MGFDGAVQERDQLDIREFGVARLGQRLVGQINFLARNVHLVGGSLQIEKSLANLDIDLTPQIVQLVTALR